MEPQIPALLVPEHRTLIASPFSGLLYTKALSPSSPVVSIVTYPTEDYAGDRVRPDGGDWSQYPNHPYVNWNHRFPIGRGTINHRILRHEGKSVAVAVGQTTFIKSKADLDGIDLRRRNPKTHRFWDKEAPYAVDELLQAASQAERLVRDDIATGVSAEFDVDDRAKGTDWWELPTKSVLENRPAIHFENWRGLGYAHARQPVNPGCQTLAGQSRFVPTTTAQEKAISIAQTGKLPGGEVVCKALMESFADLINYRSPVVSVNVQGTPPTQGKVVVKGDTQEGMTTDTSSSSTNNSECPSHGCQALLNAAQALMDSAANLEKDAARSDHPSIRKYAKKKAKKLRDEAGDLKARAEKLKATFDSDSDDDDVDPTDEEEYTPSQEEKAIETDATGAIVIKSFDWKPRRMTFQNLDNTVVPTTTDPGAVEDRKIKKAVAKANDRLTKSVADLNALLDAALSNGKL